MNFNVAQGKDPMRQRQGALKITSQLKSAYTFILAVTML